MDELDRLCKKFWHASKCLPEGCERSIDYSYEWVGDEVVCVDSDECLRAVCELEVDFNDKAAYLITSGEWTWGWPK